MSTDCNSLVTAEEFYTDCVCRSSVAAMYVHTYIRTCAEPDCMSHCCSGMAKCQSTFLQLNTDSARVGKLPVNVLIPLQRHYLTHYYCTRGYVVELLLKLCT